MTTPFGTPFEPRAPRSIVSTLLVDPAIGFDVSRSPLQLQGGATPNSDNFIMREGRLTPRPMLSILTDSAGSSSDQVFGSGALVGGAEISNVAGARFLMFGTRVPSLRWLQSSAYTWRNAFHITGAFALGANDYWDWTQIFDGTSENIAVGARTDRGAMAAWVPGATTYSDLTGAPGAKTVCAFDNYLLAANLNDGADGVCIQRVRWSDRGSASSWTGGLSGFEDLLSARGGINRLLPLESRVAVFFDDEIWLGAPVDFPSIFRFVPFDTTLGCPYPWTATVTPKGIMFMARNFELQLLPKEGGPAVAIGQPIHRSIRDAIVQAPRAFGLYDGVRNQYQLYYSNGGVGNTPHNAVFLDLATGVWAPQSFASAAPNIGLLRGFTANLPASRGSTWDDYSTASIAWDAETLSWDDMLGLGSERQTVVLGSSGGTVYEYKSTATSDAGIAVRSFWESRPLGEEWPGQQKTVTEVRADYAAQSASTLTVRGLQGTTFSTGTRMQLPASSLSQGVTYLQTPSRNAAIRVESEAQQGVDLHRFFVTLRVGGR